MNIVHMTRTVAACASRRDPWLTMTAAVLLVQLGGCALVRPPVNNPAQPAPAQPARTVPAPAESAQPMEVTPPPPAVPVPVPPTPPPPVRHFQLGAAATALVANAHQQAASGNPVLAINTLERALRIEPDNPLLWIELGQAHQTAGHYDQAGAMGRKALQLATGDPHAQAGAWHLIADSLKARGRDPEAEEAQKKADQLSAR